MKTRHLIFLSLVALAYPILTADAESAFVYSEQVTKIGDAVQVCYQIVDINAKPIGGAGIILSLDGKQKQEELTTTDANGITIASFVVNPDTFTLKIAKILGNNTYTTTHETKITVLDSGVASEPKTKSVTLAAKPKVKTTCSDQAQTKWEMWDQDGTATTYFDLNTWTTVKTDKTKVIEITQGGKTVKVDLSLKSWQKDIDAVLIKNGLAPTTNPGTTQKVTVSESLKKSDTKKEIKKDTKKETKEKTKKETKTKISKDTKTVKIKKGQTVTEKITGTIPMNLYERGKTADVTILRPDGKTEMQQTAVGSKGKFEHLFRITDKTIPGKYEITISYAGMEVKKFTYEIRN